MAGESGIDEYLKRIDMKRPVNGPDKDYLNQLHVNHLTHIAFEAFDLIDLKQLNISPDYIFDRLVGQQRGGVCFQMNGLFAWALRSLNYHVQLFPCTVHSLVYNCYTGVDTHLCLHVTLKNNEQVLCDVGFSQDFLTPLFFQTDCIQYTGNGFFRILKIDDGLYYRLEKGALKQEESISLPCPSPLQTKIVDIDPDLIKWTISYRFRSNFLDNPIELDYFQDKCPYVLNAPDVILNHCSICHIHVSQPFIGGYSIMGKDFNEVRIKNGFASRTSTSLADIDDEELKKLLNDKFHIIIERKLELVNRQTNDD